MRRLLGLVVVAVLAGCGSGAQSSAFPLAVSPSAGLQSLYIADVDGPPVDLLISGAVVASVPCAGYARITEGSDRVPRLPWSLDVRRQGGAVLQHFDVTTADGFTLLLRGDSIALGQIVSTGLSADPDACARWSAQPSATAAQGLHVENGTTKAITVLADGAVAATVAAGGVEDRPRIAWRVRYWTDRDCSANLATRAASPCRRQRGPTPMATLILLHEVDDVDHWLASPRREELFGPLGMSARTFVVDRATSNKVGLILETPSLAAFQAALTSPDTAEAMKYDGVRPETLVILTEG